MFTQAGPHDHNPGIAEDIDRLRADQPAFRPLSRLYKRYDVLGRPFHVFLAERTRQVYRHLFGARAPPLFGCYANALFAVPRDVVRRRPLSFYRRLLALVDGTSPPYQPASPMAREAWRLHQVRALRGCLPRTAAALTALRGIAVAAVRAA